MNITGALRGLVASYHAAADDEKLLNSERQVWDRGLSFMLSNWDANTGELVFKKYGGEEIGRMPFIPPVSLLPFKPGKRVREEAVSLNDVPFHKVDTALYVKHWCVEGLRHVREVRRRERGVRCEPLTNREELLIVRCGVESFRTSNRSFSNLLEKDALIREAERKGWKYSVNAWGPNGEQGRVAFEVKRTAGELRSRLKAMLEWESLDHYRKLDMELRKKPVRAACLMDMLRWKSEYYHQIAKVWHESDRVVEYAVALNDVELMSDAEVERALLVEVI